MMTNTLIRGDIVRRTKPQCRGRRDTSRISPELYSSHVVITSQPICVGRYGPFTIKSHIVTTSIARTTIVLKTTSTPDTSQQSPTDSPSSTRPTHSRHQTHQTVTSSNLPPSEDQSLSIRKSNTCRIQLIQASLRQPLPISPLFVTLNHSDSALMMLCTMGPSPFRLLLSLVVHMVHHLSIQSSNLLTGWRQSDMLYGLLVLQSVI